MFDDLAMAEVAARRIQAVYRGHKGRAEVQKLAARDGSPIFQTAIPYGSPNTTNIGGRLEPPKIGTPLNASAIERAEWTSSTVFEVPYILKHFTLNV